MRTCILCDIEIKPPKQRFCCERHYQKYHNKRRTKEGYFAEYQRQRSRNGLTSTTCPECDGPKDRNSKHCIQCHGKHRAAARTYNRQEKPMRLNCPYCDVEMRPLLWRRLDYMHCPGCGLETLTSELRRIHISEAAA